jgi:ribosome-binding ATPase YchF (GTP1/OBG family)|tara:strand:- start:92 stop:376 length:285 start_codon:yes stop_codon:yes gene_type:complete
METVTTTERVMENPKSINEEEKKILKEIQSQTQSLVLELGEIEMIKIQLEKRYKQAKDFLSDVEKKEKEFTESIFKKYGKINLNPKSGDFTKLD